MRWFWTLVVACLVAVAGVRPPGLVHREPDRGATLGPATAAVPALVRRARARVPDHALPTVVVPEPAVRVAPRVAALGGVAGARVPPAVVSSTARSSRGPPLG